MILLKFTNQHSFFQFLTKFHIYGIWHKKSFELDAVCNIFKSLSEKIFSLGSSAIFTNAFLAYFPADTILSSGGSQAGCEKHQGHYRCGTAKVKFKSILEDKKEEAYAFSPFFLVFLKRTIYFSIIRIVSALPSGACCSTQMEIRRTEKDLSLSTCTGAIFKKKLCWNENLVADWTVAKWEQKFRLRVSWSQYTTIPKLGRMYCLCSIDFKSE